MSIARLIVAMMLCSSGLSTGFSAVVDQGSPAPPETALSPSKTNTAEETLLGSLPGKAARSVRVVIKNDTDQTMTFSGGRVRHGRVTELPPSQIGPADYGGLFAESNGFMTGTEGEVRYQLAGVPGEAVFHWDNPFVGSNSASGSPPGGYSIEKLGDTGNRTLVFFTIHPANRPVAMCNPRWVINDLGRQPEGRLDEFDRGVGFLTTPFKRMGIGGWVDTGCQIEAWGWPVRDAQYSTDGFWTIDVRLYKFVVGDRQLRPGLERYVRIEVEPGTPAHAHAHARTNQFIHFTGRGLIDTHHGEELMEVHPWDPIYLARNP